MTAWQNLRTVWRLLSYSYATESLLRVCHFGKSTQPLGSSCLWRISLESLSLFEKFFNHRGTLLQLFPHWPLRAADITIQSKVCGNFEKRWHSANISSPAPQNKLHQKCHQVNFGMWTAPTRKLWRKLNCVVVSLYRSKIQMKACTTDKLVRWCSSEKQGTNTLRGAIYPNNSARWAKKCQGISSNPRTH